jgi:hypothetical protein
VPVWHDKTKGWVRDGKLVLLGVTQEQHPERCRLFAQWKGFDWPILHDPINVLGSSAVPVVVAIDEHGIVRSVRPRPETLEKEFVDKTFADDPAAKPNPTRYGPTYPPAYDRLAAMAKQTDTAAGWRALGDALALWGGEKKLNDAVAAYSTAVKRDAKDGPAFFRLGVCLRRRSETAARERDDFRSAVGMWETALDLDPNQYIWRRRIQQYGPRLGKPYPFYDWVGEAEAAIRERGERPIGLPVRPDGAEIAAPAKTFPAEEVAPKNPDPKGRVSRDKASVVAEVVTVPARVKPGESARVHVTLRLKPGTKTHWNNETDALQLWVDPPDGWAVSERPVRADRPKVAVSDEERRVGFEVKVPAGATGDVTIPAYALYHLCDDAGGQCRFVRLDVTVVVTVGK